MEREISSGAMLGVVLLALAAVIGLGFGVFAIAKGVANEGTVNVQDSLGTVSEQVFLDYDQKIITGTQAIAGLKTFEGKPYAVLVRTLALRNGRPVASTDIRTNGKVYIVADVTNTTDIRSFINYNAVVGLEKGAIPSHGTPGQPYNRPPGGEGVSVAGMKMINGAYVITDGFAAVNGNIVYDNQIGGIYKTGNAEFISTASKFQANLLKDPSGNNMGIVLEELAR